jgi:prepilin-type N-terminal cleavage/methylation domain-containing protein
MRKSPGRKRAFTLVELLIVITIIVLLISFLFVGYGKVNYLLKEKTCQNNLNKIGAILTQYCQRNKGYYPDVDVTDNGFYIKRSATWGSPPMVLPLWTAMGNVAQLKENGATEALFTCPFAVVPPGTVSGWDKPWPQGSGNNVTFTVSLNSYMFIFNCGADNWQGWNPDSNYIACLRDGRRVATSSNCKGNIPIVADILYYRAGAGAGWYHGGGFVSAKGSDPIQFFPDNGSTQTLDVSDSPGFPGIAGAPSGQPGSACNTLFAGGYVVHSEPQEFEDISGALNASDTTTGTYGLQSGNATWWFALGPSTK